MAARLLLLLCNIGVSAALLEIDVSWGDREKTTSGLEDKRDSFNSAIDKMVTKVENHVPVAPEPLPLLLPDPVPILKPIVTPLVIPDIFVPTIKPTSIDLDKQLESITQKPLWLKEKDSVLGSLDIVTAPRLPSLESVSLDIQMPKISADPLDIAIAQRKIEVQAAIAKASVVKLADGNFPVPQIDLSRAPPPTPVRNDTGADDKSQKEIDNYLNPIIPVKLPLLPLTPSQQAILDGKTDDEPIDISNLPRKKVAAPVKPQNEVDGITLGQVTKVPPCDPACQAREHDRIRIERMVQSNFDQVNEEKRASEIQRQVKASMSATQSAEHEIGLHKVKNEVPTSTMTSAIGS
jgi:hypothetical protein